MCDLVPLPKIIVFFYKSGQTNILRNSIDFNKLRFPWKLAFFGLGTISEKTSVGDHFQCAKFHACIKKCTIHLKFRAKPPDYMDNNKRNTGYQ